MAESRTSVDAHRADDSEIDWEFIARVEQSIEDLKAGRFIES